MASFVRGLRTATVEMYGAKPPRQFEQGRLCRLCETPLSRYNPSPYYCFAHEPAPRRTPVRWI